MNICNMKVTTTWQDVVCLPILYVDLHYIMCGASVCKVKALLYVSVITKKVEEASPILYHK